MLKFVPRILIEVPRWSTVRVGYAAHVCDYIGALLF
jgi:hypothetical protein